jgi:hypothetical protein
MTTRVVVETSPKKVFVSALDWPGWSRSGKGEEMALEAFLAAAPRYAKVARRAKVEFLDDPGDLEVVDRVEGGAGTEFGVPSVVGPDDRRAVDADEARQLAKLVAAAWEEFDSVAATAPEELRKGPRGGGRDRTKIVGHVNEADAAYAHEIGVGPEDRKDVTMMRAAMLEVVAGPSDGTPLAGRRWTLRYAARRIAWHALDHAWEIEDRSER